MLMRDSNLLIRYDRKLALSFGAVVLILMLTASGVTIYLSALLNQKQEDRLSGAVAAILSESISRVSFSGKYHARLFVEEMQSRVPDLAFISVESKDGQILAHSNPAKNDQFMADRIDTELRLQSLKTGILATREHVHDGITVKEVVLPYRGGIGSEVIGVVRTGINFEKAREEQKANILRLLILIAALTALAIWGVLILSHRFGSTVRTLAIQLQGILNHSPLAIGISDQTGQLLAFSVKFEELFGCPAVGQTQAGLFAGCLSDSNIKRLAESDRNIFENGVASEQVLEAQVQGHLCVWHVSTFPITKNNEGKTTLICTFIQDITEETQKTEALLENERRLSNLMVNLPGMAYRCRNDKDWMMEFVSAGCYELLGYAPEDIINNCKISYNELIRPEDQQGVWDAVQAALSRKDHYIMEYRVCTANGKEKWVWEQGCGVFSKDGELNALEGFITDITERKQAERSLADNESRLRTLVQTIPDLIWLKDVDGVYLSCNRMFELFFGAREADIVGKTDYDFLNTELADFFREHDRKAMALGRPSSNEEWITFASDGHRALLDTIKTPMYDNSGSLIGVLGIGRDITERKLTEEEKRNLEARLQRAEKMEALGTLAGGVAHDLNNVLGIVVGYAEMLLDNADESSPLRSGLLNILNGGQRAAAIIEDLLTLARRGVSGRTVLNLNKIIIDYQKSPEFANLSSHHPLSRVRTDLEPDLLNISGSSIHLGKTLMNLIINAIEAMPEGGELTIRTANRYLDKPLQGYDEVREGDYVVLSVSDTGQGIPVNDLKRIFEPFYTKKVMGRSGTGLGLAVVWGTIKDHHGYINVQSEEGKGSTFTLYFPVTREEISAEALAVSISEYMGNGESILVVDDVKEQRELASAMLRKLNYTVANVSSGEEAVAYLREHTVDLMVLDMIMDPGMDGLDTYRNVLEIDPKQKAVIVSGFSESERVHAAQKLGAGSYVKKPYIIEKLGLAVRKEIDRST